MAIFQGKNVEEILKQSEECHRHLFETMPLGVVYQNTDGAIVSANPAAERMLGITLHKMQGKSSLDSRWKMIKEDGSFVPGAEHPAMLALKTGEQIGPVTRGISIPERDDYVWLSITAVPQFRKGEAKPFQIYAIFNDITKRKQAEDALREQHDFSESLIETAQAIILVLDVHGRIVRFNPYMEKILGYRYDEVKGQDWFEMFLTPEFSRIVKPLFEKAVDDIQTRGNVNPIVAKDGTLIYVEWYDKTLKDDAGNTVGVLAIGQDITERMQVETKLIESENLLSWAQKIAHIGSWKLDLKTHTLIWSDEIYRIFGFEPQEFDATYEKFIDLVHPEDREWVEEAYFTSLQEGRDVYEIEHRIIHQDTGDIRYVYEHCVHERDETNTVIQSIGTVQDITNQKASEREIHRLAYYDSLTQLPNRRLLYDRLNQAMAGSGRSGYYGALMFMDIDNFKTLNDTRGHHIGDQLLVEIGQRIIANLREGDTVSRMGGDEFVVMLEDLNKDIEEAAVQTRQVADKLLLALALPYDLNGEEYRYTASLGVVLFQGHKDSIETLLKHADMAMYEAKNAGGNAVHFFDPAMQTTLNERIRLETDLRKALVQEQLVAYYQAQLNSQGEVMGAELLLRWLHPEQGLIPPLDFIPLAEATGLILPIGRWVLETACQQLVLWSKNPATQHLRLAVNVSALQFRQVDFVDQIQQILSATGADPENLRIELTESVVLDDVAGAFEKMLTLKAQGVSFEMDDFGTGYSSLSYLTRLPLDTLKIDSSFVFKLPDNHNDAVVVQTIISMARSLGLNVIAEGVETESQRAFLEHHQCHVYQGYLFSRPLPLDEFEQYNAAVIQ